MLRKIIAKAAPTCTLWRYDIQQQAFVFRPWPSIKIGMLEVRFAFWSKGNCPEKFSQRLGGWF